MDDIPRIQTVQEKLEESVLGCCERLLERAKAGDIKRLIVIADLGPDGWTEMAGGAMNLFEHLGMVDMAQTCIRERLLGR